ncbi:hypothetical protein A2U01_0029672, partial [Trifolium medium]|nr:hypothetical protein [Trifolium medium]
MKPGAIVGMAASKFESEIAIMRTARSSESRSS